MVVCLGRATRLIQYVQQQPKRYQGEFQLGLSSDTEDIEGQLVSVTEAVVPDAESLLSVIPQFVGEIQQRPPAYSALKVKGKRAYKLARQGQIVDLAPRAVTIHNLKLVNAVINHLASDFKEDSESQGGPIQRETRPRLAARNWLSQDIRHGDDRLQTEPLYQEFVRILNAGGSTTDRRRGVL